MQHPYGNQDPAQQPTAPNAPPMIAHGLPGPNDPWPRYDEHSLLENAVYQVSMHMQVAQEMATSSALGVMAAACQGLVDVEFPNGHRVPTSLMLLILADSGERKTSVDSLLSKPLSDYQREKLTDQAEAIKTHETNIRIWNKKQKELERQLTKSFREQEDTRSIEERVHQLDREEPQKPKAYKFIYQNTTPSALSFGLHENIPLGFLLSDEAGGLLKGQAFQDLYIFNSLWSGTSISVDRRTEQSYTLDDARLSASMMIQPEILNNFFKKRGQEANESGFMARFLVSAPPPQSGFRAGLAPPLNHEHLASFHQRVTQRIETSIDKIEKGEKRHTLQFTPTAKELWKNYHDSIEHEMQEDHLYTHARDHANKLMDNISRVAAVVHTFEKNDYTSSIEENTLRYAYFLCCHYSKHYLEHVTGTPKIVKLAEKLVLAIRKHGIVYGYGNPPMAYRFTKSTIKQYASQELRDEDHLSNAINLIEKMGHIQLDIYNSSYYILYETISPSLFPLLRNGVLYHVKELPMHQHANGGRGLVD